MNIGWIVIGLVALFLVPYVLGFAGFWLVVLTLVIVAAKKFLDKTVTIKKGEFKPEFKGPILDFGTWSVGKTFLTILSLVGLIIAILNFSAILGFIINESAKFTQDIGPVELLATGIVILVLAGFWFLFRRGGSFAELVFGIPILILFLGLLGAGFYYLRQIEPFSKLSSEWILLGVVLGFGVLVLVLLREEKSVFKFLTLAIITAGVVIIGYFIVQEQGFSGVKDFLETVVKYAENKPQFFFMILGTLLLLIFGIAIPFEKSSYKAFRLLLILGIIGGFVYFVWPAISSFRLGKAAQGITDFYLELQGAQSVVTVPGDAPPPDREFTPEMSWLRYDFGEKIKQIDVRFSPGDKVRITFAGGCTINQEDPPRIWLKIGRGETSQFNHPYIVQLSKENELIIPTRIRGLCPGGACFPRFAFAGCLKVNSNKLWIDEFAVNGVSRTEFVPKSR